MKSKRRQVRGRWDDVFFLLRWENPGKSMQEVEHVSAWRMCILELRSGVSSQIHYGNPPLSTSLSLSFTLNEIWQRLRAMLLPGRIKTFTISPLSRFSPARSRRLSSKSQRRKKKLTSFLMPSWNFLIDVLRKLSYFEYICNLKIVSHRKRSNRLKSTSPTLH